jgi:class 3 adenylate cyclase
MGEAQGGGRAGLLDRLAWSAARGAVEAVRYGPSHVDLLVACGTSQPEVPHPVARWLVAARGGEAWRSLPRLPQAIAQRLFVRSPTWLGPTGTAFFRWLSGAAVAAVDRAGAVPFERPLRARVHPGLLVPHPHAVAVLALDMRGFSALTRLLDDTQYLTDLVEEYLTELTAVVERHRGVVFQYTGDGLLAIFLPELMGVGSAEMLDALVDDMYPAARKAFEHLYARWRMDWRDTGRPEARIGLGAGLSFGEATIGFIGPAGKKQFGVIGEPVNLAAFLCSEARAGNLLVDLGSFARAAAAPPVARLVRVRSRKRHQRVEALCLR